MATIVVFKGLGVIGTWSR